MEEHLEDILTGNYTPVPMAGEGNINYKQDFDALCEIDRDKPATYGEVIAIVPYLLIIIYMICSSLKAKPEQ